MWALVITFADVKNNAFLTLGGAAWKTKRERDANLRSIPASASETDYLLDIHSPRGIEDDQYLNARAVEKLLSRPLDDLIADARRKEGIPCE